jgi:glyoxylase-like metal-dependent hydrolase (beta-lactamase superfamily II)
MGVPRDPEEAALHQVRALGYRAEDVTDIICTHLHIDHAGGLSDFPQADVHVYRKEYQFAQKPRGVMGFAYDRSHWAHNPHWIVHDLGDQTWFGLDAIRVLTTPETEFYLLPLPGHTPGHCGVAIGEPGDWLLHCGDAASPYHPLTDLHDRGPDAYRLSFIPRSITEGLIGPHSSRLKALLKEHHGEIRGISSHDIFSFKKYYQSQ